ncbi:MAG: membrane protein insertase YidC [Dokdonella sp.]
MNNPRSILLLALLMLGYLLYAQWQTDYSQGPKTLPGATTSTPTVPDDAPAATVPSPTAANPADIPTASAPATAPPDATTAAPPSSSQRISVTTDLLHVEIDARGGSVVVADLLAYPRDAKTKEPPVRLFSDSVDDWFVAQSGLVSSSGAAPDHQAEYQVESNDYRLADGQASIEVPLTWTDPSGVSVRKVYRFERGSYVIDQRSEINNASGAAWTGNSYQQLQRVPIVFDVKGLKAYTNTEHYSFVGAADYSPADKFQKLAFDKFGKDPLNKNVQGGWVAMIQHYFFAAWIPPAEQTATFTTSSLPMDGHPRYLIRSISAPISIAAGAQQTTEARLYVGPKLQSTIDDVAPGLSLTANYGIFTIISQPLHWVLAFFHSIVGNWGFSIILLVLLIKAVFFKLSEAQYRSMAKMRKMQPRIQALKERFGDDKQKVNAAMMELYQKEKINPLGGCLPMLIQMPVFFALYWVLLESVELRHAPFIGWIHNLTAPDPYFVLPVLNALTMIATQYISPMTGMDPTQAKIMKVMPVMFSVLFAFFPAGLVLYWTTNGMLSLLQQWIITKRVESGDIKMKTKSLPAKSK